MIDAIGGNVDAPTPSTVGGRELLRGLKCPPYTHISIAPSLKEILAIEAEAAAAARTALLDELEVWARDGKQPMWRTARLAVLEWINRRRP